MAKKFTDLTADATPTSADVMATARSPFGAGTSRKVTLANLFFQLQQWMFGQDAGGTDAYAVTLSPAPAAYVTGVLYRFKANTANTGAATVDFNGLGAKTIKKLAGGITTDLSDNDIRAGQWVEVVYDGTNMQMVSQLGNAATSISGLTAGTIPKAASPTTLTDSTVFVDGSGVNIGANDLIVTQSILNSGTTPKRYISGNVSNAGGISLVNNNELQWVSSNTDATTAGDIGMSRFGAGSLEINKGNPTSAGTQADLRDVILRSLTATTAINFAADAGVSDAYAITLSPAITTYVTGQVFFFKANTANTGACSLNVNGLGAKTIKKLAGAITTDLSDNDIRAGQYVIVMYDGTNMQMMSQLGNASSGTPGGSDTQVQFNNAGAFGGSGNFVWSSPNLLLSQNNSSILGWWNGGSILSGIIGNAKGGVRALNGSSSAPGVFYSETVESTGAGALNPWHTLGQVFRRVMGGNITINRPQSDGGTNSVSGPILTIILVQDATGNRLATWATEYKWGPGGTGSAPTLSTAANAVDIFRFWVDGSNQAWEISRSLSVGGAAPGGSTTQVQFNDAGVFAGDSGMVWDKTNDILTIAGRVRSGNGSGANPSLSFTNATDMGWWTDGGGTPSNLIASSQGVAQMAIRNGSGNPSTQVIGQLGLVSSLVQSNVSAGFALQATGQLKVIREGTTNASTIYCPTRTVALPAGVPTPNLTEGNVQRHTLTGDVTFAAPGSMVDGIEFTLILIQDGTGGHTAAWNSVYKFVGGTAPTMPSAANAVRLFKFWTDGTNCYEITGSTPFELSVACSDETTSLTAGTAKVTFRMPRGVVVTEVRASLVTAQASGSIFTVDINESGTSILSTKLTIDNTEKTSTTAATPAVISDSVLADDAEMTVDIDQIGDGTAAGLKVTLIGIRI